MREPRKPKYVFGTSELPGAASAAWVRSRKTSGVDAGATLADKISRLRHPRPRGYEKSYPAGYSPHAAYNEALDDVLTILRGVES